MERIRPTVAAAIPAAFALSSSDCIRRAMGARWNDTFGAAAKADDRHTAAEERPSVTGEAVKEKAVVLATSAVIAARTRIICILSVQLLETPTRRD